MRISSTLTRWQRHNMGHSLVVVRRRPCEPHYPTVLNLGGGSRLKWESNPSPIRLVFWGSLDLSPRGPPELRFSDCIDALGLLVVVGSTIALRFGLARRSRIVKVVQPGVRC
jgi:hypothetical protein